MSHRSQAITTRTVAEIALYEPQTDTSGFLTNVFDVVQTVSNADAPVASSSNRHVFVALRALAADHVLTMPAVGALHVGQHWTFKDTDNSLTDGFTWTLAGNGQTIDGLANFVLAQGPIGASPGGGIGPGGWITLEYVGGGAFVVVG